MKTKYYSYLAKFLNEAKRERILFELQSKKKRENAFSKITVFSEYFNDKHSSYYQTIFKDFTMTLDINLDSQKNGSRFFLNVGF